MTIIPVEPFDFVIFGGTGDLAIRKLIPALYHRYIDGQIPEFFRILCVSRSDLDDDSYRSLLEERLTKIGAVADPGEQQWAKFASRISYLRVDANGLSGWAELSSWLAMSNAKVTVFYLATSPNLFGPICDRLRENNMVTDQARIVVEKPIGRDLESAIAINRTIASAFREEQTYRIDHYLGKETVQNLLVLRFGNSLFEPVWNASRIDHVQITVSESVGLEGRHAYYESAGALRDMVQNHILQLLCLVAMEPPSSLKPDAVRDEKLKVLRSLRPIRKANVDEIAVRGQYREGAIEGRPVPGYAEEVSGNGGSATETFAALKVEIDNWRWAGVPFYLRTGKRLARKSSEIVIHFRAVRHDIFSEVGGGGDADGGLRANRLIIKLQPDEGVRLHLMTKEPGPGGLRTRQSALDLSFANNATRPFPDAYERLILDVVRGNQTLFMRRDEVEAAWEWIEPLIKAWQTDRRPPKAYMAGSWGPVAAIALTERDGRNWHEEVEL